MDSIMKLKFPGFTVQRKLGSGGCGTVYLATLNKPLLSLKTGSKVAVKIIHPELLSSATIIARLKREVEIGLRVRSRNVVSIYGVDRILMFKQSTLAIIMELIEGTSLKTLLHHQKTVKESTIIAVTRQICNGLAAIHGLGIVHRDVKPANLIMTLQKRVVLTDLGIARLPDISAKVTATGAFIGTCTYASPEQFSNMDQLDPRSDLYSLGVVMYELATGINPFKRDNIVATVHAHLTGNVDPPKKLSPEISDKLNDLIMSLLAKNPDDRPDSARTIIKLLDSFGRPDTPTQIIPKIES